MFCHLCGTAKQNWHSNTANTIYQTFKYTFGQELYLGIAKWRRHRVSLARLRTGSNQLAVNRLKGRVPRHDRLCKYCIQLNKNHVEVEFHFVMNCPLHRELRSTCLMEISNNANLHLYRSIMSTTQEALVKRLFVFSFHSFKLHKGFMMLWWHYYTIVHIRTLSLSHAHIHVTHQYVLMGQRPFMYNKFINSISHFPVVLLYLHWHRLVSNLWPWIWQQPPGLNSMTWNHWVKETTYQAS